MRRGPPQSAPGPQRAWMANAHKTFDRGLSRLFENQPYTDLGADYLDRLRSAPTIKRTVGRLARLGFRTTLTETRRDLRA